MSLGNSFRRVPVLCLSVLLLSLFGISSVMGANWYVDNAAAGANNGKSWANAWTSFSRIVWGTGGVSPGDTLYISGGAASKTYYETLTQGNAGNSGARITISVGQDSGHNGKVIIDGQNTRTQGVYLRSYSTLTGNYGGSRNIVLQNYFVAGSSETGGAPIWANGTGSIIEYVEISAAMNGIYAQSSRSIEIRYCYLHDIRGGYGIRVTDYYGSDFMNAYIHHNTILLNGDFVGTSGGPDGVQCVNGLTMHDNILRVVEGLVQPGQHPDGIQAMGWGYVRIYNNYFANFINSAIKIGPVTDSFAGYPIWQEQYIYNNVIVKDLAPYANRRDYNFERGIEIGPDGGRPTTIRNIFIVNNTFVDLNFFPIAGGAGSATSVSNLRFENNLFYNCGRNSDRNIFSWFSNGAGGYTIDYNLTSAGDDGGVIMKVDSSLVTQAHPRTGVPTFVSYLKRALGSDFRLASGDAAAKDQGVSLASYLTTDKDGVSRPQGSAWDIGAYEGASGTSTGTLLSAPRNLRVGENQ